MIFFFTQNTTKKSEDARHFLHETKFPKKNNQINFAHIQFITSNSNWEKNKLNWFVLKMLLSQAGVRFQRVRKCDIQLHYQEHRSDSSRFDADSSALWSKINDIEKPLMQSCYRSEWSSLSAYACMNFISKRQSCNKLFAKIELKLVSNMRSKNLVKLLC